jgi:NitT/TauT family transport system ATP-binding protein
VLNGIPVDRVPDRLAVVFQDYSRSLYPWLSVRDNVALPLQRTMRDRGARKRAAVAALEAVGLPDTAHKYPWQLSGGMQQRVAIARALAYDPVLLLMDEPFGSVDAQTREDLEDLVLRVRAERGITILLVTHDIDESVYVGDRVIVLTPGPGRVRADITTSLPQPRDQITTKELPEFVHLRTEVSRLVRGQTAAVLAGLSRGRFAGFERQVLAAGKQPAPAARPTARSNGQPVACSSRARPLLPGWPSLTPCCGRHMASPGHRAGSPARRAHPRTGAGTCRRSR